MKPATSLLVHVIVSVKLSVPSVCVCLLNRGPVIRVLLFNATGERDCVAMLKLLVVSTADPESDWT